MASPESLDQSRTRAVRGIRLRESVTVSLHGVMTLVRLTRVVGIGVLAIALSISGGTLAAGSLRQPAKETASSFALKVLKEATIPPHGRLITKDVSGVLGRAFETPAVVGLIDLHRFYLVDELAGAVESYVAAHLPKGAHMTISTSLGGTAPSGGEQGYALSLAVSGTHEYLAELVYYFQPVGTGGDETEIRIDSHTVWEPSRSAAERAPSEGTVEVTGFSQLSTANSSSGSVTVRLSTAQARRLRATLNALPLGPPATCMEDSLVYRVVFRPTKGSVTLFEADGWACAGAVVVTTHGHEMPNLYDRTCSLLRAVAAVLPPGKAEGTRHAVVGCKTS